MSKLLAGVVVLFLVAGSVLSASGQFLGMGLDRAHPELDWYEFETEHFLLIYHQGLEDVAVKVATIAEQVYEPITAGLEIEMDGKTSIVMTDEDQIINGFAVPGKMFLWVNQNDYAVWPGKAEKWLRLVVAHEFQHDVWFEAARDWTGLFGLFQTPAWFVEGLAEYKTEEWGAGRSDVAVRSHILRNRHEHLDPHDSGFSKVRYLAEAYGDSVIVQAVKKRNALGLADFAGGFKEATGITLGEFHEEWRRVATAHTYAIWGQKEPIDAVGEHLDAPARRLMALAYSPDGAKVAALTSPRGGMPTLYVVDNDSTQGRVEVDHGILNADVGFSPDGKHLVYAKMHRAKHGSLLWDLKVADTRTGKSHWITQQRRASHPHWSPVEERIVFTAIDGSTTNLYTCGPFGDDVRQLTDHPDDVQILTPRFSPDGRRITYARFDAGRGVDIGVLDVASGEFRFVTDHPGHDQRPFWSQDGTRIFFTADRNRDEVPNLYAVPAEGSESDVVAMSDVGEALFGMDVDPLSGDVVALALATVDSVRARRIPADRLVTVVDPVIRPELTSWRDRVPPHPIPPIDYSRIPERTEPRRYRAVRHIRPFQYLVWPSPEPWGAVVASLFADAAHRNLWTLALDVGTRDDSFQLRGAYGSWNTMAPLGLPGFLFVSGGTSVGFFGQLYGGEFLYDYRDEAAIRWRQPLNFGEHLYANHNLELGLRWDRIDVEEVDDLDFDAISRKGLPAPALDYEESVLDLTYRYTKSRPHRRAASHAQVGQGLLARVEWSDEAWGSDFFFRRLSVDANKVVRMPLLGGGLMLRARAQSVWGDPAPQDFTGLRSDVPLIPTSYSGSAFLDDLFRTAPGYFLRGYPRDVIGDRAALATLEWRVPLLPPPPVEAFGISPGGITGVLFYDHGRVWKDGDEILARHGVGWELRAPLRVFGESLFVPAYGEGQTLDWERDGAAFTRDWYVMLAFTQGF